MIALDRFHDAARRVPRSIEELDFLARAEPHDANGMVKLVTANRKFRLYRFDEHSMSHRAMNDER
jgi:hypothetical protein